MQFILSRNAFIFLFCNTAVKRFRGVGAAVLREQQLVGHARASACLTWGAHVLPIRGSIFESVISRRGYPVGPSNLSNLEQFVMEITEISMTPKRYEAALNLIPTNALIEVLLTAGANELIEALPKILSSIYLPFGPTHGDLHRDNFLIVDEEICVIDCDRFRAHGSPLFDRLHFRLSEFDRENKKAWLRKLISLESIVSEVSFGYLHSSELILTYGLQRIAHECSSALIMQRDTQKYYNQVLKIIEFYEENKANAV